MNSITEIIVQEVQNQRKQLRKSDQDALTSDFIFFPKTQHSTWASFKWHESLTRTVKSDSCMLTILPER